MEENELRIQELDNKIQEIDARIHAINEKYFVNKVKGEIPLDIYSELCELRKAKNYYELEKYDIIHGTHKVQIKEIEKKVMYLSISLGRAKERLAKSNMFNEKKNKEEVDRLNYAINDLQAFIIELEGKDMKIEGNDVVFHL